MQPENGADFDCIQTNCVSLTILNKMQLSHVHPHCRWLSDVEIVCSDGSLMSHRLVLAAASPNFLRNIFDDLDHFAVSDSSGGLCTLLCPDVTISEMARVLCLVYRGEAILESTVDATKYHNCLKLITCLGIPIEDFVVGTRNTVAGGRNPVDQHQVRAPRLRESCTPYTTCMVHRYKRCKLFLGLRSTNQPVCMVNFSWTKC